MYTIAFSNLKHRTSNFQNREEKVILSVRGLRGAITVDKNTEDEMVAATKQVVKEMIEKNAISPEQVAQVLMTVTEDLNATFPAKALRLFPGWTHVPVMCATEIPVPNGLEKCIRIMMTINTDKSQTEMKHIYLRNAVKLRPELLD